MLIGALLMTASTAVSAPALADHQHSSSLSLHSVALNQAPQVQLVAVKDVTGGFNVHIITSNFRWSPEHVSQAFIPGEGHAHLYLDGVKIGRVYAEWFHVNTAQFARRAGEQLVSVELAGDDHAPYAVAGVPVRADAVIDVPEHEVLMRGEVADSSPAQDARQMSLGPSASWTGAWLIGIPIALGLGLVLGTLIGRRGRRREG